MLLQIFVTVFSALCIAAELYLYITHGLPQTSSNMLETPYWGLTGFGGVVEEFYGLSSFLFSIPELVYQIFMMVLLMGLLKSYSPKNYTGLGLLSLFIPEARFISIFVLRNRKAINFEQYMRARREEYIRQRQQYQNQYGNSYGNPYGNPYGYGGQQTTRTPYNTPQNERPAPPEEPFAEFGTGNTENTQTQSENATQSGEDFFD
jgi:hypothetical protein